MIVEHGANLARALRLCETKTWLALLRSPIARSIAANTRRALRGSAA
jgi:hypothetical protein